MIRLPQYLWRVLAFAVLAGFLTVPSAAQRAKANPAADRLFQAAAALFKQSTYESVMAAKEKAQQACAMYETSASTKAEADCWTLVGRAKELLAENPKIEYETALGLYREARDQRGEAVALNNLGGMYRNQNEPEKSLANYNQALPLLRATKNKLGEANTLGGIGEVYLYNLREFGEAIRFFEQSLALRRALADKPNEIRTIINIGDAYRESANRAQATNYYNQAITLARASGDRFNEARATRSIGAIHDYAGELPSALEYYQKSLAIFRSINLPVETASLLNSVAFTLHRLDQQDKALALLNEALPLAESGGDESILSYVIGSMGEVYFAQGDSQKALANIQRSLELGRKLKDKRNQAYNLVYLGRIYESNEDYRRALDYYNQGLQLAREGKDVEIEVDALRGQAVATYKLGDDDRAQALMTESLAAVERTLSKEVVVRIMKDVGAILAEIGSREKALELWNQGIQIAQKLNYKLGEREIREAMAKTPGSQSNSEETQDKDKSYTGAPVTLDKLLAALRGKQVTVAQAIEVINANGVDFELNEGVQEKLVAAGATRQLLNAINNNYRTK